MHGELSSDVRGSVKCDVGIPPGSVLGTLMFSLDKQSALFMHWCHTQMYPDDTAIHVHGKNREETKALCLII